MAKKVKFESFVYQFLSTANAIGRSLPVGHRAKWERFVGRLEFRYDRGSAMVDGMGTNPRLFPLHELDFHHRGDEAIADAPVPAHYPDSVEEANAEYFRRAVQAVALQGGFEFPRQEDSHRARLRAEEAFHDAWAGSSKGGVEAIDVRAINEACTSPEMRYIKSKLGALSGKKVLDVGCGLGEASVYFALQGADVTAMDLSQGMLDATARLASRYGVQLRTHKSAAEDTALAPTDLYDVIYAGNLMHHVDIGPTIRLLKRHLAPGGQLVTWDPLAYNPVINIYRSIATEVRTADEHPLKWKDIRLFHREFRSVTTAYFWLTALSIFVVMAVLQRRNPNNERYWKSVVAEADKWAPLYRPLSRLDALLLKVLPPMRLLCWNVVILAKDPT